MATKLEVWMVTSNNDMFVINEDMYALKNVNRDKKVVRECLDDCVPLVAAHPANFIDNYPIIEDAVVFVNINTINSFLVWEREAEDCTDEKDRGMD